MTSEDIYANVFELQKNASSKYANLYIKLCKHAKTRAGDKITAQISTGQYIEKHHILPRCIRPDLVRDKNNLVYLTAREHFIAHKMLIKMTSSQVKRKMQNAISKFLQTTTHQHRVFNQTDYAYMRSQLSAAMSRTKIITNGVCNERLDVLLPLPDGWWYGSHTKGRESKLKGSKAGPHSEDRKMKQKESLQDYMHITDGAIQKKIKISECIPPGFYMGRQNGVLRKETKAEYRKASISEFGYQQECEFKCDLLQDIQYMSKTELATKYSHTNKKNHNLPNIFFFVKEYGLVAKRGKPGPKLKD